MGRSLDAIFFVGLACTAGCVGDSTIPSTGPDSSVADGSADVATETSVEAGSDGGTVDADAGGSWSPKNLGSSVVLWLAGDDQVTLASGKVAAWGDLSSAGNSAVQGNVAQQPTVSPTLVNGHKTVRFTPCNYLTIPDTPSLQFGTGGFTLAVVASYTNAVDAGAPAKSPDIFVKQALTPPYQGILLRGNNIGTSTLLAYVQSGSQVESVAGMNTGALHRIVVRRTTPTQLDLRVDGVSMSATITSTDVSAVGFTARIGGLTANSECLQGDIAEMVVVNTGVSGADATQLETYFKTKYGL